MSACLAQQEPSRLHSSGPGTFAAGSAQALRSLVRALPLSSIGEVFEEVAGRPRRQHRAIENSTEGTVNNTSCPDSPPKICGEVELASIST
jgi:prephenate dehydratase